MQWFIIVMSDLKSVRKYKKKGLSLARHLIDLYCVFLVT